MSNHQSQNLVRLTWRFLQDHWDRDWEGPEIVRSTSDHVWVSLDDPRLQDLYDDASFYGYSAVFDCSEPFLRGLVLSARATVKAIEKARQTEGSAEKAWDKIEEDTCKRLNIDRAKLPSHI